MFVEVIGEAEITPPKAIRHGSRVVARRGCFFLVFAIGEHFTMDDGSDMTFVEPRVVKFDGGSMQALLRPEERLRVRTLDAEIEAQGASFRVSIGRACEGNTRIEVERGAVVLHHRGQEIKVSESWLVCTKAPAKPPQSTLVEQNDAFAEAIAAKRSGQPSLAIARFEERAMASDG